LRDTTRPIQLRRASEFEGIEVAFECERARLLALLPAAEVLYTGGTSIPGALTRGDLDVHVRVAPADFVSALDKLSRAYASYRRETWTDEFATFVRADAEADTGVALTAVGGEHDGRFLIAWWRLRSDPQLLAEYNALKEAHDGATEDLYRVAKCAFFDRLTADGGSRPPS
jgi:GrpB-like predicted nucleotidyltransferase (UPF0157 family)